MKKKEVSKARTFDSIKYIKKREKGIPTKKFQRKSDRGEKAQHPWGIE